MDGREVGVWVHARRGVTIFECDGCGWERRICNYVPLVRFDDTRQPHCGRCQAAWTHVLGLVRRDGQLVLIENAPQGARFRATWDEAAG